MLTTILFLPLFPLLLLVAADTMTATLFSDSGFSTQIETAVLGNLNECHNSVATYR